MFDLWVLLVFSILGYVMKKLDYPAAPLVLALVLGNGFETALRQSLMISQGDMSIFFARPISGTLMAVLFLLVLTPLVRMLITRARAPAMPKTNDA
jgi:TctA family transporter